MSEAWRIVLGVMLVCGVASCGRRNGSIGGAGKSGDDATVASAALSAHPPSKVALPSNPPAEDDAMATHGDAAAPKAHDAGEDNRVSACRLIYGPAEQPFRGPAALVVTTRELSLVANDNGKPRIFSVAIAPPPAPRATRTEVPSKPSSFAMMRQVPCEVAGSFAYCPGSDGTVYRTKLGANDTKAVAKSLSGMRIAAASLDEGHAVVATLDTHRTSEGEVLQAFVTLDEGPTQRLSEDGAGATAVRMVPRGRGVVAVYLDARTAMVPVHARTLALRSGHLSLGSDAVVFIGGPPERGIDVTLAQSASSLHALVPLARDMSEFGMVAIEVPDPLKDDAPAVWSLYPNGLDPAPMGATTQRGDAGGAWVARVRPAGKSAHSPRVLELGRLDSSGTFTSRGILADSPHITDVAVATDAFGAVWIVYGNASSTWLERRLCP